MADSFDIRASAAAQAAQVLAGSGADEQRFIKLAWTIALFVAGSPAVPQTAATTPADVQDKVVPLHPQTPA